MEWRTVSSSTVTTDGTTAPARSVTFIFGTGFTGTVGGATFTSDDTSISFEADRRVDIIGPINYTVSAGSMAVVFIK